MGLIGRRTGTRPSFSRAGYAGEYEYPVYGVIYVDVDGRRLTMRYNQIVTLFEHWHFEVFNGLENVAEPVFHNTNSVRELQLVQPNGVFTPTPVRP